ncbi:MAG: DUF3568 family protein [Candidatus Omnitrophica bacterium]|nr:DUF3568 family protein [Candidatus Omnitrophota bacterium]
MFKNFVVLIIAVFMLMNICGCVAVVAGAAGGAGTSTWLSGKLSQEVNASYDRAIDGCKRALESMKLRITKETRKDEITQIKSNYTDGKTIWIDVRRISDRASRVEVRVGMISDKAATEKVLNQILKYL